MSVERKKDSIPTIKLVSSFDLGGPYDSSYEYGGYDYKFDNGLNYEGENKQNIANLEANCDIALTGHQKFKKIYPREIWEDYTHLLELDGTFKVPINLLAKVYQNRLSIDYEIGLTRPDGSLTYLIRHTHYPDFYHLNWDERGDRKIKRTRINGLPIYLRINDWPDDEFHPTSLTLFRRGLKEIPFLYQEGATANLHYEDVFKGNWHERWKVDELSNKLKVKKMEVGLQGNWVNWIKGKPVASERKYL